MNSSGKILAITMSLMTTLCFAQNEHINPYRDTLEIARYPLTHTDVLDAITDSTVKYYFEETSFRILKSVILNPNSSDKTLNKIAHFLLKQPKPDEDVLLTLACHKNISNNTLTNIAKAAKDKGNLKSLYEYCEYKLKIN